MHELENLKGTAKMLGCTIHIGCNTEEFKQQWREHKRVFWDTPAEDVLAAAVDESTKRVREDWNAGRKGQAIGRIPVVLAGVIGGKGFGGFRKLGLGKGAVKGLSQTPGDLAALKAAQKYWDPVGDGRTDFLIYAGIDDKDEILYVGKASQGTFSDRRREHIDETTKPRVVDANRSSRG